MAITIRLSDADEEIIQRIMNDENLNTKSKAVIHAVREHTSLTRELERVTRERREALNKLEHIKDTYKEIQRFKYDLHDAIDSI